MTVLSQQTTAGHPQCAVRDPDRDKTEVTKHEYTFSELVNCGLCGCALVAEKKKGKSVYYHCTGNKGKCAEPYMREVLDECFDDLLKGLVFDDQVMDWIVEALHQSHADEKRFREDAITSLQEEQSKIQNRLDRYMTIGLRFYRTMFFQRWRQTNAEYQEAAGDYVQDVIRLLELSKKASNSLWKDQTLTAPIANRLITNTTWQRKRPPESIPATFVLSGSAGRTRTYNPSVNSRMLCH
jgi:site-specific DNA recombinase